ncbi:hypothetical protein [Litoribrevibacter albus]|uniref:Uncharacterized protein n=1 Tax=Litoribrevibacter albus TaxID=1473156 RepID=A0AA37SD32_9GAMM|nr:hypothetical protein [Litoribrevibacter albus]GLQ32630.1 hypothetical protein GCM10007876_31090 [Litoribrevibacter albus]
MKNCFSVVLGLSLSFIVQAGEISIPSYINTLETSRVGDYIFRYVLFSTESDFPCIRTELLDPINNRALVDNLDVCAYDGKSFSEGFAAVSFNNPRITESAFEFELQLFALRGPEEYNLDCSIEISGAKLGSLECH